MRTNVITIVMHNVSVFGNLKMVTSSSNSKSIWKSIYIWVNLSLIFAWIN